MRNPIEMLRLQLCMRGFKKYEVNVSVGTASFISGGVGTCFEDQSQLSNCRLVQLSFGFVLCHLTT